MFVCIHSSGTMYAQWTEKDSLWLKDVLSGKEQIRLNPETKEAIEKGTFINTDPSTPKLIAAPPVLPISRDFDIAPPDTSDTEEVSSDDTLKVSAGAFALPDLRDKNRIRIGNTPVTVAAKAGNIYNEQVKDGYKRGGFTGSLRITFSLNDILMGIFDKTERNKRRNKKRAQAWKIYNDYPEHLECKKEQ